MKTTKTLLAGALGALLLAALPLAQAAEEVDPNIAKIQAALAPLLGDTPAKISASPVNGLYEVLLGMQVIYVSADGRFLLQGEIMDLGNRENITKPRENTLKAEALSKVGEENMVIFGDPGLKHTITVFTDIDCGYCRKLHSEIQAYNDAGIRVRYMFFPRAGVDSDSYNKAVSVWCSDKRNEAMTDAKAGKEIPKKDCTNPVKEHLALGEDMGVTGTPAIVLNDGELLPGYVPAARLAPALDAKANLPAKPTASVN